MGENGTPLRGGVESIAATGFGRRLGLFFVAKVDREWGENGTPLQVICVR